MTHGCDKLKYNIILPDFTVYLTDINSFYGFLVAINWESFDA